MFRKKLLLCPKITHLRRFIFSGLFVFLPLTVERGKMGPCPANGRGWGANDGGILWAFLCPPPRSEVNHRLCSGEDSLGAVQLETNQSVDNKPYCDWEAVFSPLGSEEAGREEKKG